MHEQVISKLLFLSMTPKETHLAVNSSVFIIRRIRLYEACVRSFFLSFIHSFFLQLLLGGNISAGGMRTDCQVGVDPHFLPQMPSQE